MGFYTLADGRKVEYTDGDVLRDVADLFAITDGEFEGTASASSEILKGMMGDLQSGKPLDADQWVLLQRLRGHYAKPLARFRASDENEFEGYVPVPPAGAGRISEVMRTLSPSRRAQIKGIREEYSKDKTAPRDRQTTPPHLVDTVTHDLAHARQHMERLSDSDVVKNPDSIAFNAEHALNHVKSAQEHMGKLSDHLTKYPSSPRVFSKERVTLAALKEANPKHKPKVCVDFDGVIHQGPHGLPGKVEGVLVPGTAAGLKQLHVGHEVIVLTARVDHKAVQDWLEAQGVSDYVDDVTNIKPAAAAYIDDRAVHFTNWEDAIQSVDPNDETPLDGEGKVLHESGAPIPPNLRTVIPMDEKDGTPVCCGTCKMFDRGVCWGFGNYSVMDDWVCDRWVQDPMPSEDTPVISILRAAQANPASLLGVGAVHAGRKKQ